MSNKTNNGKPIHWAAEMHAQEVFDGKLDRRDFGRRGWLTTSAGRRRTATPHFCRRSLSVTKCRCGDIVPVPHIRHAGKSGHDLACVQSHWFAEAITPLV